MNVPLKTRGLRTAALIASWVVVQTLLIAQANSDPGVRLGAAGAGGPIAGLTLKEGKFFNAGLDEYTEVASVDGSVEGTEEGLGPRFNLTGCATCHSQPAVGGTSPAVNPQVDPNVNPAAASQIALLTSLNVLSLDGPIREVRFSTDGGVHDLFTIQGLPGTPAGCSLEQPDFAGASAAGLLRFRIPSPTFGLGLIEAIEDAEILSREGNRGFGISGRANRNGNDGTVTRFGWKAQNKSLTIFAGEAYNVEQGITNELFPDERGENGIPDSSACMRIISAPQDAVHYDMTQPQSVLDNVNAFANFMRFLAGPVQAATGYSTASETVTAAQISAGEQAFDRAGCSVCHTKSMTTGNHLSAALRFKTVKLFSDLLLHDIGTGDDIGQGAATGAEFRTAPLWGIGQRLFFLHDGRASDLLTAINAHRNQAAEVIGYFNGATSPSPGHNLTAEQRQNLLRFLRSL
jgi:CxxC motif-containing protein (DUF1111 family)